MNDVSNNTIMALLLVALLITVTGTVISTQKIRGLAEAYTVLTTAAAASASGESNITITSSTSITNNVANINFGAGSVNATCISCLMDSNDSNGINASGSYNRSCCVNFTNVTSGFLLENTGNINISVNFTCGGSCTPAEFIGSTVGESSGNRFQFITAPNSLEAQAGETGVADTALSCFQNNSWTPQSYTNVTAAGQYICGNSSVYPLDSDNTRDAVVIHLRVNISGTTTGVGTRKNATFTFGGLSSG